jgi:hypothetical protein
MTPKTPKKAAEGPIFFRWYSKRKFGDQKCRCCGATWSYDDREYMMAMAMEVSENLRSWLKTPSGKRWMEENGVGE